MYSSYLYMGCLSAYRSTYGLIHFYTLLINDIKLLAKKPLTNISIAVVCFPKFCISKSRWQLNQFTSPENNILQVLTAGTFVHPTCLQCIVVAEFHIRGLAIEWANWLHCHFTIFGESSPRVMHDRCVVIRDSVVHYICALHFLLEVVRHTWSKPQKKEIKFKKHDWPWAYGYLRT